MITRGFVLDAQDRSAVEGNPGARRRRHRRRQRGRADRSRVDEGEDPSGPPAVFPQAFGTAAVRAAGRDGDLTWHRAHSPAASASSWAWRCSPTALIWLISLASYNAADPVWFFNTGSDLPPANFAGRIGAFIGELSYQMLGYAAYLMPLVLRRHRLALLLVPDDGRRLYEADGRGAALRLHLVVPVARLRHARRRRQGVPRRRLHRRSARGVPGGIPQPYRLDHPDPDAALRGHHPVDAVLVRAALLRPVADGAGAVGRRCAPRSSSAATRSSARSSARKSSRSTSGSKEARNAKDSKDSKEAAPSPAAATPGPQRRREAGASSR